MTAEPAPSNHPVFLLAEHLDMILAAIEDLQAADPPILPAKPQCVGDAPRVSLRGLVDTLRQYEMVAVMRVGQARGLTRELVRRDKRFAMLGGLFVGGTAALDEAVQRMVDTTGAAFAAGGDPVSYLRSRGVIGAEASGLEPGAVVEIDNAFLLAGEIEVGPLAELIETFLNTIELHFDLFPDLMEDDDVRRGVSELAN